MYKKIVLFVSTLVIVFTSTAMSSNVFASVNDGTESISPLAINYYTVYFKRTSSTSAKARVIAEATVLTEEITSKITLQKYNSSTESYSNISTVTKKESGTSITHEKTFSVASTGKYRIKVTLYDGSTTQIKYKTLS